MSQQTHRGKYFSNREVFLKINKLIEIFLKSCKSNKEVGRHRVGPYKNIALLRIWVRLYSTPKASSRGKYFSSLITTTLAISLVNMASEHTLSHT